MLQNEDDVQLRCLRIAEYMVRTEATVRMAAKEFGVSKSTVHKDMTERLARYNRLLYGEVKRVLAKNKAQRHLRGGEATRQKYLKCKVKSGKNSR